MDDPGNSNGVKSALNSLRKL